MSARKLTHPKTSTLWRLAELAALKGPELKQKLLERMANSEDAQKRFWDRVTIGRKNQCWEWKTTLCNANGCGIFNISPRKGLCVRMKAHRISYYLTHNFLPDELEVCHSCDNPPCCNPHHLFLGTQADNVRDCQKKGRNTRGETHVWHKLKEKEVKQIRKQHSQGNSIAKISRKFQMSWFAIYAITTGLTWKHVK